MPVRLAASERADRRARFVLPRTAAVPHLRRRSPVPSCLTALLSRRRESPVVANHASCLGPPALRLHFSRVSHALPPGRFSADHFSAGRFPVGRFLPLERSPPSVSLVVRPRRLDQLRRGVAGCGLSPHRVAVARCVALSHRSGAASRPARSARGSRRRRTGTTTAWRRAGRGPRSPSPPVPRVR